MKSCKYERGPCRISYVNVANYKCFYWAFLPANYIYPRSVITRGHSNKLVNYHLYPYSNRILHMWLHWNCFFNVLLWNDLPTCRYSNHTNFSINSTEVIWFLYQILGNFYDIDKQAVFIFWHLHVQEATPRKSTTCISLYLFAILVHIS